MWIQCVSSVSHECQDYVNGVTLFPNVYMCVTNGCTCVSSASSVFQVLSNVCQVCPVGVKCVKCVSNVSSVFQECVKLSGVASVGQVYVKSTLRM